MAKQFQHLNPRSRKPNEYRGTWKGRNYRRGVMRSLGVNFLVFSVILGLALYSVYLREEAKNNPRVWTLNSR